MAIPNRRRFLPLQIVTVLLIVCPVLNGTSQAQNQAKQRFKTEKGVFTVPGTAFIDGRDLEATPPLTVMSVSVWDSAKRRSRVCSLPHGASVSLAQAERVVSEDRYYFRVVTKVCE